jgi:hypothetical protein
VMLVHVDIRRESGRENRARTVWRGAILSGKLPFVCGQVQATHTFGGGRSKCRYETRILALNYGRSQFEYTVQIQTATL